MGFIPSGQRNTHPTIRGCHPTSDLRTTRLDVTALEHAVEHYFHSGIAPSTSRVYAVGANRYLAVCDQLNTQPLPTSEQLLCKFAAHLATLTIAYSSIKVYLAAVRQLHVRSGLPPPRSDDMAKLQQVLRGIKISQGKLNLSQSQSRRPRRPISLEILQDIRDLWAQHPQDNDRIMLWTAFTTCFFGFLRAGKLCVHNAHSWDFTSDLLREDVMVDSIETPRMIRLHLRVSKTDQFREGSDVYLPRTYCRLCPVAALLSWMVVRGCEPGPLFRFSSGKPLTRSDFVTELKGALSSTGRDPSGYSGHSFRSGAATTAAMQGISDSNIKLLHGQMEEFRLSEIHSAISRTHWLLSRQIDRQH